MEKKVSSIPFRFRTSLGDYTCKDGEIGSLVNGFCGLPAGEEDDAPSHDDSYGPDGESGPYEHLLPPAPRVEFSLSRGVVDGWHNHPDNYPSARVEAEGTSPSSWGKKGLDVLEAFGRDAGRSNLFVEPFFVMCALRLRDGSHILPSSPVLMVPNSEAPLIVGGSDLSVAEMDMRIIMAACRLRYRVVASFPLQEWGAVVDGVDFFVSSPIPLFSRDESPLSLHRVTTSVFSHSSGSSGVICENRLSTESYAQGWQTIGMDDIEMTGAMVSADCFCLVGSLPLKDLKTMDSFADVPFNRGSLSRLPVLETYHPDFAHHNGVNAASHLNVSGRATLCDLTMTLPEAAPYSTMAAVTSGVVAGGTSDVGVEVTVVKNGDTLRSMRVGWGDVGSELDGRCLPRWLFYPDPDATSVTMVTGTGTYVFPMRRHPSLHGSFFWCGGLRGMSPEEMGVRETDTRLGAGAAPAVVRDSYRMPSALWRGKKGNGMLLPDSLLMNLDVERVVAVCRAFRASGLVATTSPTLYLFSSEGVFLLKEMDDGSLRDAGLMGAYVLRDASSFRVEGRMVVFVTDTGKTMTIDGTVIRETGGGESGSVSDGDVTVVRGDGSGKRVELTTRPLKLGDAETLKRVMSVSLRGVFAGDSISMVISGSRDLHDWQTLASGPWKSIGGIWGPSVRYVTVKVEVALKEGETLEGVVVRWL
ncbi:MAG: hypothetical protein K2M27_05785 [Muribaculaceae bacterium]|nr:hypothetical protein [Muribaculaceae bacterium]